MTKTVVRRISLFAALAGAALLPFLFLSERHARACPLNNALPVTLLIASTAFGAIAFAVGIWGVEDRQPIAGQLVALAVVVLCLVGWLALQARGCGLD